MSRKKKNILQIIIPIFAVIFFLSFGVITHGAMYQNINPGGDQTVAPGAANFESGEVVWVNNAFVVRTRAGGTGVVRGLQLTTGANAGVYIDSSGNVGIGTTGPNAKLEILSPTIDNYNDGISFGYSSLYKNKITGFFDGTNPTTGSAMQFKVANDAAGGNTAVMTLKGSGNVGIGTTSPGAKLDIAGGLLLSAGSTETAYSTGLQRMSNGDSILWYGGGTGGLYIKSGSIGGAGDRITITQAGNVGIGTTGPSYKLDVVGGGQFSQPVIVGTPTAASHAATKSYVDSIVGGGAGTGSFATLSVSGTSTLATTAGSVGIGNTIPQALLQVGDDIYSTPYQTGGVDRRILVTTEGGSTGSAGIKFGYWDMNNTAEIAWDDNPSRGNGLHFRTTTSGDGVLVSRMYIDKGSGYVGIRTTNPGAPLEIAGTGSYTLRLTQGGGYPWDMNVQTDAKLYVKSASSGNFIFDNWGQLTIPSAVLVGGYTSVSGGVAAFNGNVGIGTTSPGFALDVPNMVRFGNSAYQTKIGVPGGTGVSNSALMSWHESSANWFGLIQDYTTSYQTAYVARYNSGTPHIAFFTGVQADGNTKVPERMRIAYDGNVGIGTTGPSYKLDVVGGGQFSQPVIVGTPTAASHAATKSYVDSMFTGSGQWTTSGSNIYFSLAGNVGIGTTGPGYKLDVRGQIGIGGGNTGSGGTSGLGISLPSTNNDFVQILGENNGLDTSDGIFLTGDNTTDGWKFRESDCCGAGTLDYIVIRRATPQITIYSTSTDASSISVTNGFTSFSSSGTNPGYSFSGGNVGIGTTSPGAKLDVRGAAANMPTSGSTGTDIFRMSTTGGDGLMFGANPSPPYGMWIQANYLSDFSAYHYPITLQPIGGNVGIGTTGPSYTLDVNGYGSFNQPVLVGTPTAAGHAATKSYVDSIVGGGAGTGSFATLSVTGTSTLSGNLWLTGAMYSNLNMNGKNISGVNKLTVTTLDPLYEIEGAKYATYASAIAGGVKEEYIGRGKLIATPISNDEFQISNKLSNDSIQNSDNKNSKFKISEPAQYQYVIDFNKVEKGSDLWVWYKAIDFSRDNVEVLATAYDIPIPIAYTIEGQKIIFKANNKEQGANGEIEFSYRLVGKRFDWRQWPTYAKDQSEPAGLIVK